MQKAIDGLEPYRLWEYFAELSAIPRCSKHEATVSWYIYETAKRLGLEANQDSLGNVVVRKPAAAGRLQAPSIVLQCHLDMVCEKNRGTKHDFERDPIVLKRQGDYITADGTTLGADNGIGVAVCLALMADAAVSHGPLEFLFTVDEETGLTGAAGLGRDFLTSRFLINLDSEDENVLCVGCAGGMDSRGELPVVFDPLSADHAIFLIRVSGLRGGHSGLDIHRGRANAIKLLVQALSRLDEFGVLLCSLEGGNKRNAIPREAQAVIGIPAPNVDAVAKRVQEIDQIYKDEYASADSAVALSLESLPSSEPAVLSIESQHTLLDLLHALPHGAIAMNRDIPDLVETSTNLAGVHMKERAVVIETSQRGMRESEKESIVATVCTAFRRAGATITHGDGYAGWTPDPQSPLVNLSREIFRSTFGKEPGVKAIHAGLECGIIGEKFPGMDMISLGPDLRNPHSPDERVHTGSVERFWNLIVKTLETLSA